MSELASAPGPGLPHGRVQGESGRRRILLGTGLLLIAFNLRPAFSSVSPVLPELMTSLAVSPAWASVLTTGPILCLGLFAPVAPGLAARYGLERVLFATLVVLSFGTALRGIESFSVVLLGSVLAGAGIAMMNVLVPAVVKRDFSDRTALMTGSYAMLLCAGAAIAAGATVPLMHWFGESWSAALAAWSLPVLVAAFVWAPQLRRLPQVELPAGNRLRLGALWRDPLAWQISMFMGTQSAMAYCVFAWLAPILRDRGVDPVSAGLLVSLSIFSQVVSSFLAPALAVRWKTQQAVGIVLVACATLGLVGALFGPLWSLWIWAVLQGLGQGGLFSVVMTVIILRSPDARTAAGLSGMAQGIGYVFAASGPLLVGLIRSSAGSFAPAGLLFAGLGLASAAFAWGAGRNRLVLTRGS